MEQWQLALAVLGLAAVAIGGAFTLGRMWPRAKSPGDSDVQKAVKHDNTFEHEFRAAMVEIRDRLLRIEMSFAVHPNYDQVRAMVEKAVSDHEFNQHKIDRREGNKHGQ